MRSKCCRSLPRCASCPVVLAARSRVATAPMAAPVRADLFELLRGTPPRELPVCVLDALETLDERRFQRSGRD